MKVVIVYRSNTEYERDVIDYLRDFTHRTGKELEQVDPDTRDGSFFCETYDIVECPSVVALDDEGRAQNIWRGIPLPLIDEVSYYAQ